jgi:flagellar protein FliO/FliZ
MDLIDVARYLGALALVLALVGFAALAARRFGLSGFIATGAGRRLQVVESLMIDARNRAFILRRDDKEHLVVIGPEGARVIESGFAAKPLGGAA